MHTTLNYDPTYHDETLDPLIQQILPDIQQSLKKQLLEQLQQQAQDEFEKQLIKIKEQAQQQYQLAIHDLQQQGVKLLKQQSQQLKKQFDRLKKEKKSRQQAHFKQLQQRYISQNFQQLILGHQKMQQIQSQLALQILQSSSQKIQATKQRRLREIAVKMQNKEQKNKKQRQKAIKNQIYHNRSIDQLKKDIQVMKIVIASMKSQYNVKIKKIDTQIKQIKQKNKTLQPKQDINVLRRQLQKLQNKRQEINQRILHQKQKQNQQRQMLQNNQTFSHLDYSADMEMLHKPHVRSLQTMLHRDRDAVLIQQNHDYSQSDSQSISQQNLSNGLIIKPPLCIQVSQSKQHLETFYNQSPILKLNVASLLRTNWQDPLQKYISFNQNQNNSIYSNNIHENFKSAAENNQNDSKVGNKQSFQEIYHQHLQKLNQATKRKKLSNQTKKAIMKSLTVAKTNKI